MKLSINLKVGYIMNKITNLKFIALLIITLAVILSLGAEDVAADNVNNLEPEISDIQVTPITNITLSDNLKSTNVQTPEIVDTLPTTSTITDNSNIITSPPSTISTSMTNNSISTTTLSSITTNVKDKTLTTQTTSSLTQENKNLNLKNENPNGNILSLLSSFLSIQTLNIPNLANPTPELTTAESTISPFIELFLDLNNNQIKTIINNLQLDQFPTNNINFKLISPNRVNSKPTSANVAIRPLAESILLNNANINSLKNIDLSINMDYEKDLTEYKKLGYSTTNDKIIYGTDTILLKIKVTNNGPEDARNILIYDLLPPGLTFIKADVSKGSYNDQNGEWKVENISKGSSETLNIKVKVSNSGDIHNQAIVKEMDKNPANNIISRTINAHNPVILVNGFPDKTNTWNELSKKLKKEGIKHFIFNYPQTDTIEPKNVAHKFFEPYVNKLKNTQRYNGKFDIVCYSTGSLLTRFYIEDNNNKNSGNVGQLIGIGPVNFGVAIEDLIVNPDLNPEIAYRINQYSLFYRILPSSTSAKYLQTTDSDITELNKDGIASNIIYRVIMGVNAQEIPGLDTVGKFGDKYKYTSMGDGFIANEQSILPGAKSINIINGVKHSELPQSHEVEDIVVNYLKTT
jgi:uncharacterized repeat protein (TIGR01451 family)